MPRADDIALLRKDVAELKRILAKLLGADDTSAKEAFSMKSLDKAQKLFNKMRKDDKAWVSETKIYTVVRGAGQGRGSGKFIREHFEFNSWIKDSSGYRYLRKDLVKLNEQLKKRNIDLEQYRSMLLQKADFEKKVADYHNKKGGFKVPEGIEDITTSDPPYPDIQLITERLAKLEQEFKDNQWEQYIDVYTTGFAMKKSLSDVRTYMKGGFIQRLYNWCFKFNYACMAYQKINYKRYKSILPAKKPTW